MVIITRHVDLRTRDKEVDVKTHVFVNRAHTIMHVVYGGFPESFMRIKLPKAKSKELKNMHSRLFETFINNCYKRFL